MTHRRFEYAFELKDFKQPVAPYPFREAIWRNPSPADKQILAHLMLDSYRGTIDYDDETIEDALNEVATYYSRLSDPAWLQCSWLLFMNGELACASLVGFWQERNVPLISYIMTASRWKGKHLATNAVWHSLQCLADKNYAEVHAVITEGNLPSEKIFTGIGFKRLTHN